MSGHIKHPLHNYAPVFPVARSWHFSSFKLPPLLQLPFTHNFYPPAKMADDFDTVKLPPPLNFTSLQAISLRRQIRWQWGLQRMLRLSSRAIQIPVLHTIVCHSTRYKDPLLALERPSKTCDAQPSVFGMLTP